MIPAGASGALASAHITSRDSLSPNELQWLIRLAAGGTVTELAEVAHYSEREMFRRLRVVYQRLGAKGKVDAIARAMASGIIPRPEL